MTLFDSLENIPDAVDKKEVKDDAYVATDEALRKRLGERHYRTVLEEGMSEEEILDFLAEIEGHEMTEEDEAYYELEKKLKREQEMHEYYLMYEMCDDDYDYNAPKDLRGSRGYRNGFHFGK